MKKQFFILFLSVFIFSQCDLPEIDTSGVSERAPINPCENDIANVPTLDIVWEKDLNLNEAKAFSPIIYKNFVLTGKENVLSFFNKETGALEKTLNVSFPVSGEPDQNLDALLQGNCFIEGEHLVFQRHFSVSGSYEYDTLYTELLNLETGNISRVDKSLVAFDHAPFDLNRRINLFGNNTWINNAGDTLVPSFSNEEDKTLIEAFNISTNQMAFELEIDAVAGSRGLLLLKDETIYFRGRSQLIAIDALSQSILWEQSDLKETDFFYKNAEPYNRNLHIADNHVIDFSRGDLTIFDKNTGELILQKNNMPDNIKNTRTVVNNNELIVIDNGIFRINLSDDCAIWQTGQPNENKDFSGIVTHDETLNRLYAIKDGKLVCIQL